MLSLTATLLSALGPASLPMPQSLVADLNLFSLLLNVPVILVAFIPLSGDGRFRLNKPFRRQQGRLVTDHAGVCPSILQNGDLAIPQEIDVPSSCSSDKWGTLSRFSPFCRMATSIGVLGCA